MTTDLLVIPAALIAVALVATFWWLKRCRERQTDAWLPRELRSMRLAYAERLFRSKGAFRISARIDRAYRDRRGYLILVELKTRDFDKVYPSDVIELSAQRVAITAATGEAVHEEAYVLVQGTKGKRSRTHRVKLLTEAQVVAIAERREALLSGTAHARRTCINGICDHCAFVSPCRGSR